MSCEYDCFNCPLIALIDSENAGIETEKLRMVGKFEHALEQDERLDDRLALLAQVKKAGVEISPGARAISTETLQYQADITLRRAAVFLDEYFGLLDRTLELNRGKVEAAQTNCDGPKESRQFFTLLGHKILVCGSKAVTSKDRKSYIGFI